MLAGSSVGAAEMIFLKIEKLSAVTVLLVQAARDPHDDGIAGTAGAAAGVGIVVASAFSGTVISPKRNRCFAIVHG